MAEEGSAFFVVDHAFELACGACSRTDEMLVSVSGFVDMICSADGTDFHFKRVSQPVGERGMLGGGEGELSFVAEEGSAVCHTRGRESFLKAPYGAVGGCVWKNFCIAVVLEVGDRSASVKVFVEAFGRGGFGEVSGSDEDEFSVLLQVEDGFVDEEQVEVGAVVKKGGRGIVMRCVGERSLSGEDVLNFALCCGENVLEADVGGVSDDRVEFLGEGIIEEVYIKIKDRVIGREEMVSGAIVLGRMKRGG